MSGRLAFMRRYIGKAVLPFLDVGSSDDPFHYGDMAVRVDIDDYPGVSNLVKADVCDHLPFPDKTFHTVVVGDVVEHMYDPEQGIRECARVCSGVLVMTIYEELRIPPGRNQVEAMWKVEDEYHLQRSGVTHDKVYYPGRIVNDELTKPHLAHIHHFTQEDIDGFCKMLEPEFTTEVCVKVPELVHEGVQHYNWLVALRRVQ